MRSSSRMLLTVAVTAAMIAAVPVTTLAANAFGLTYKGEAVCQTVGCHSTVNHATAHDDFAKDVQANPSSLVPSSGVANAWPSPGLGAAGLRVGPANIWLQIGSSTGLVDYIGLKTSTLPALSGTTVWPALDPTDDAPLLSGLGWDQASGAWEAEDPVSAVAYFQRCAGCHHLGVTRPGSTLTTLANDLAQIGPSTPTSISGLSIQCEVCHGTGKAGVHMGTSETVVAWPTSGEARILSSEICGQCHVSGTATEVNITGGSFSSPNGYTPDETLSDFLNVRATVPTPGQFVAGNSTYYFFPNGSTYRARHVYYNEWKLSGHSRKLTDSASHVLAAASGNAACLKCHSGEGFLARIGASVVPAGFQATIAGLPGGWTTNVRYSQECVICHSTHDEETGLSLRTGVTCEVCHNWQFEVLGTTMRPGDIIRHPQREMLTGRGLLDVANGSAFMPGATCPDCHMPATYAEVEKPGPTQVRRSHRMLPMLPGDAEEWGVREGGDSCTPCHGGRTRDQLQTSIEGWQDDIHELDAVANSALRAARSRAATRVAAWNDLVKRAYTNITFVENDSSFGVHNYPYASAGLLKAIYFAKSVGARVTLTPRRLGTMVIGVSGRLTFGDGTAAGGQTVTIQRALPGRGFVRLATVTTDASGNFRDVVVPVAGARYSVSWAPRSSAVLTSAIVR